MKPRILPMIFFQPVSHVIGKCTAKWKLCSGFVGLICSLFMLCGKNHLAALLSDHRIIVSQNSLGWKGFWSCVTSFQPHCCGQGQLLLEPQGCTVVPHLSCNGRFSKVLTLGVFLGSLSRFATAAQDCANRKGLEETTVFILDIQQLFHVG